MLFKVLGYRHDIVGLSILSQCADSLNNEFVVLEVEVIIAEVGDDRLTGHERNSLYRVKFDGFISDDTGFCVIGGNVEDVQSVLQDEYREGMSPRDALALGRSALERGANGTSTIEIANLEVCLLERERQGRKFRRLSAEEVQGMLDA